MHVLLILIINLVFLPNALAGPEDACRDLSLLTCAPGLYNDGTGIAETPRAFKSRRDALVAATLLTGESRFREALALPENEYFREIVLSSSGLSMNTDCESAVTTPSDTCLELMAGFAADVATSNYRDPGNGVSRKVDIPQLAYLSDNPVYQRINQSMADDIMQGLGQADLDTKIENKILPAVKTLIIAKINSSITDETLRRHLVAKVNALNYGGSDCSERSGGDNSSLPQIMRPNAYVSHSRNNVKYCAGFSAENKSEFNLVFTMAHEVAHALDPCGITLGASAFAFRYPAGITLAQAQDQFPFSGLLDCFRSNKSVGATIQVEKSQSTPTGQTHVPSRRDGSAPPSGGQSVNPLYSNFSTFCDQDQVTETFSDWMAAEVVPEYIAQEYKGDAQLTTQQMRYGYSNIFRGLCSNTTPPANNANGEFDEHPAIQRRADHLIVLQPKIREQMGCTLAPEADRAYCPLGETPAMSATGVGYGGCFGPYCGSSYGTTTNPSTEKSQLPPLIPPVTTPPPVAVPERPGNN